MTSQRPAATCVHSDGVEHLAPSDLVWDPPTQGWLRMYRSCSGDTYVVVHDHATAEEAADCVKCSPSSLPRRIEDGGTSK